jgi:predicted NAD/FAD-binding protein
MRIAVIGSGIAGMGASLALSEGADVWLFEAAPGFGGHSHTVDVRSGDRVIPVDTGFIVYNERNYPNLCGLFAHLGVPTHRSDMSFAFSLRGGAMEWAGDSLSTVFAQRANLLRPRFLRGVLDILRFNRIAREQLEAGQLGDIGLGAWLEREGFSRWFCDCYILPMGGAIWSTPIERLLDFPARSFLGFFSNHDLLRGMEERQGWRTVTGGSRQYVERLIGRLGRRAVAGTAAVHVTRTGGLPRVRFSDGSEATFDHVVLATHAPQALGVLGDADAQERAILNTFRTSKNRVILHSDPALMPRRRKIWASWNFLSGGPAEDRSRPTPVTYWMQRARP